MIEEQKGAILRLRFDALRLGLLGERLKQFWSVGVGTVAVLVW